MLTAEQHQRSSIRLTCCI